MITIVVPVFDIDTVETSEEMSFDRMQKVFDFAIDFYINYLGVVQEDGLYFLYFAEFKVEINFGILRSSEDIQSQKSRASIPLFSFYIEKNILSLTNKMLEDKVNIVKLTETLGGYVLVIKDPFNNTIYIECEDFEDDNSDKIDFSRFDHFYHRM